MYFALVLVVSFALLAQGLLAPRAPQMLRPLIERSVDGRDARDFSLLDLQRQESFLWGSTEHSNNYIANMTLYSNSGELLISMERFSGMLKSVSCGTPNMVLVFNSEANFQYAIHAWGWVNEAESNSFLLITNYAGCAPSQQRLPYHVYWLHYDEPNFTAYLHAVRREWSEVALTFDLDIGTLTVQPPVPGGGELTRRQSGSGSWQMDSSFNQDLFSSNLSGLTVGLVCTDCAFRGSIAWEWHVAYLNGLANDIIATIKPQDFVAALELQISVSGTLGAPMTKSFQPLELPTIGGFGIEGVLYIGPTLEMDFGFVLSAITGKISLSSGAKASLSNDATVVVDFTNVSNCQFSNWDTTLTPSPLDLQEGVSVDMELYMKFALKLGLTILADSWDASFDMKLPDITATLTGISDPSGGVCGNTQDTSGVDLKSNVGVDLFVQLEQNASPVWSGGLFSTSAPLATKCLGFAPVPSPT